jgi:GMP synthase (glutamine-hydrolysing)
MKVLIVSTCAEKLNELEFVNPIVNLISGDVDYEVADTTNAEKMSAKFDKIIICGTAVADNKYLEDKFEWLKDFDKPVLGICSGIQIISKTFGGEIVPKKEIGMVEVKGNLFGQKKFKAYALHTNGISKLSEFKILARSKKSVQAIKHKSKEIYGVMFHPEVRNEWVISEFIKT